MYVLHIGTWYSFIVLDLRQDYRNYDFVDKIEYNIAVTGWVRRIFCHL